MANTRIAFFITAMALCLFGTAAFLHVSGIYPGIWTVLLPGSAAITLAGILAHRLSRLYYTDAENRRLLDNLKEINSILSADKEEYERKIGALKQNQDRLDKKVAELYTLQMISGTINSTLELERLLDTVNDIIVGIMGVNSCSICILNENPDDGIRYFVTSGKDQDHADRIKSMALDYLAAYSRSEDIIVRKVDGFGPVTRISFTPVKKHDKITGVIITGHTEKNLLNDEDINFIKSVCNQIGVAIENAMLYEKLNIMANTDGLTGLYNRSFFQKKIDGMISGISENNTLAVAIIDVDDFKKVNDRYGHDAGDVVIVGLSGVIKRIIRKSDTFVRYGGEEFILIMQNITRQKSLERLEQIRRAVKKAAFDYNTIKLSVTISIGVSFPEKSDETRDSIIKKADLALYVAKKNGKDRIEVYN